MIQKLLQKKISVLGQGFVGLPLTLLLSSRNYNVNGYDINASLIKDLQNNKKINKIITEKSLLNLYKKEISKKNLSFDVQLSSSEIFIICVPTPINKNNNPDLSFVYKAISYICDYIKDNDLIIVESTISIGVINRIDSIIKKKFPKLKYYLAYCPERVLPGNTINEIINNDRIIGGINSISNQKAKQLYSTFIKGKIFTTKAKTAEIIKLSENAFRNINIAFANELSIICDKHNIQYLDVIKLANKHPRVNILQPSIGVGGHCIPVDPYFLIEKYNESNSLIKTSLKVNNKKNSIVARKILKVLNKLNLSKKQRILFLGLSYKPNIGDIRGSPSLKIIKYIKTRIKIPISVNDPYVNNVDNLFEDINSSELLNGIKKADVIIKLVNHNEYKKIIKLISKKIYFDYTI